MGSQGQGSSAGQWQDWWSSAQAGKDKVVNGADLVLKGSHHPVFIPRAGSERLLQAAGNSGRKRESAGLLWALAAALPSTHHMPEGRMDWDMCSGLLLGHWDLSEEHSPICHFPAQLGELDLEAVLVSRALWHKQSCSLPLTWWNLTRILES